MSTRLLLTIVFLANGVWVFAQDVKGRPNLILAIADDWGYPHAGAYGYSAARTPTFDRLAREGMLFTRAFSAAPSCTASRGSILTGQAPHRLENGGDLWSELPAKFACYPDILEKAGYVVGSYRKGWGPGKLVGRAHDPAGPKFKSFEAFLKKVPADRPFCFWFGSSDPHRPYDRRLGEQSGIDPKQVRLPGYLPDTPVVRQDAVDYLAEVQRFDREVGEMLAALKAAGRAENTLILMTGDNGWPWPRAKANLYDAGTLQPLAAVWPGHIKAGTTSDALVVLTDVAPTFLEAAGIEIPREMTGRSILPILLGREASVRDAVYLERERHARARAGNVGYPARAVRTDQYLYIRNFEPGRWPAGDPDFEASQGVFSDIDAGPTKTELLKLRDDPAVARYFHLATDKRPAEELYDVRADPDCLKNLAAEEDRVRKSLRAKLEGWMTETGDPRAADEHDGRWDRYEYYGGK
ncbi:MAG TPA: sulfatase [Tepidisphaeraceae bacterium]|jgi:arylsulfatase A-like enzyme